MRPREAPHAARRTRWIDSIVSDARFAFRHFGRKPLFAVTIVLTLAVGIGGHAFELSMLRGFTRRPPPGISRDQPLARLRGMVRRADTPNWWPRGLSYPELRQMTALRNVFSDVAGWTVNEVVVDVPGAIEGASSRAHFVTDDYFRAIGLVPTHGPGLPRGSPDEPLVAVISHVMWRDVFGEGSVSGRTIAVNGTPVRIVGVAPPRFTGVTATTDRPVVWMPIASRATILRQTGGGAHALASVDSLLFDAVGHLQPNATPQSATAPVRVVASQAVAGMTPDTTTGRARLVYDADVVWLRGQTDVGDSDLEIIAVIWGIVTTLFLFVVCANVGSLVISAGVTRRQEIAVRISLGATRARIVRQLLTESVLLALMGGVLALILFWAIVDAVARRFPDADWIRPDAPTVVLTMCIALGTGFLFGLVPALQATRQSVSDVLKGVGSGATRRSRLQHSFVVAQVALTQPLLVLIAGLISTAFTHERSRLKDPDRVLRLTINVRSIPGSQAEKATMLDRVQQRIAEIPGVTHVLPASIPSREATLAVRTEDRGSLARANEPIMAVLNVARPGHFSLLGVPLLRGDEQLPADTNTAVLVSSDLAHEVWGEADPLGRRLTQIASAGQPARDLIVTGVYDARFLGKGEKRAQLYLLTPKMWHGTYLIRTAGPGADLALVIQRVVRKELPATPTESVLTLAQVDRMSAEEGRNVQTGALGIAALVLLLASIGLYGVVALAVGQRRREIGVRMALGARALAVVGLFYRGGIKLTAVGVSIGLPLAFAGWYVLGRSNQFFDRLQAADMSLISGAVAVVVFIVASVATLIPSRRAAAVDPVTALRSD
jgi:predicted permease